MIMVVRLSNTSWPSSMALDVHLSLYRYTLYTRLRRAATLKVYVDAQIRARHDYCSIWSHVYDEISKVDFENRLLLMALKCEISYLVTKKRCLVTAVIKTGHKLDLLVLLHSFTDRHQTREASAKIALSAGPSGPFACTGDLFSSNDLLPLLFVVRLDLPIELVVSDDPELILLPKDPST
jgi:hypothetical protein